MRYASELMNPTPLSVGPELEVEALARLLLKEHADGACVLEGDELVGVVTTMDLIFRETRADSTGAHPIREALFNLIQQKGATDLDKGAGVTVADIMSKPARFVKFDDTLEEVATMMVVQHITVVPVMNKDRLVGVITKPDVLRASFHLTATR